MQTFSSFFGGAFFGGEFFSTTPNVGGGYIKHPVRTSTYILLSRRIMGLDRDFEALMDRWGRPKKRE